MAGDIGLKPGQKILAQKIAPNTNAFTLINKGRKSNLLVSYIFIASTHNNALLWDLYHDNNGTTYNNSTVLFSQQVLNANSTAFLDFSHAGLPINLDTGNGTLGFRSNTANDVTITVYGMETR